MTKLQIGIAGALVAAGVTGFAIQARELSQLNRDLIQAEQLVREDGAKLGADNVALKAALKESTDADSARSTEVAALKDEANTLRNQLNAASSSQKQAASGVRGTQVFDIATVDVQPQARLRTSPKYPLALRRLGITGEATIDFVVDAQGVVQNARALKSTHSELAEAAVAAVQRWRFAPAQKGGRSVATHLQVPIIFTINDDTGAPQPVPIPWF